MLIEFSVGNFRSFQEIVTLSMVAANISAKNEQLNRHNVFAVDRSLKLLKSAAIYGANASGKSNLVQAISFMCQLVRNSARDTQSNDAIEVEPFRLNSSTENAPSHFEVIFYLEDRYYRYGFEVDRQRVHREWLYHKQQRETLLFEREGTQYQISSRFKEGKGLEERTRDNALFLSVADQWNGAIAQKITRWFSQLRIINGLQDDLYKRFTIRQVAEGQQLGKEIINFVRQLDLGIVDLHVEPIREEVLPKGLRSILREATVRYGESVETKHYKYDASQTRLGTVDFDLEEHESQGTQKIFALAGPLIETLHRGEVLLVDELEARLHPLLTRQIIELFNSAESNPHNAQLIFATHDTNLLTNQLFRRDQIWFTEKDRYGATDLYSLVEYKGVRKDASFESDYIAGKYGAIPYLGDLQPLIVEVVDGETL